jgi:hypothetical protein
VDLNNNLKEAIRELHQHGAMTSNPNINWLPFKTPHGEEKTVPVAFLADGNGKARAVPLLDIIQGALATEEKNRLENAPGPDRRKGTASHHTLGSFLQHVARFKDEGTVIWIDRNATDDGGDCTKLVAIFNYHQPNADGTPRWGDHRAEYNIHTSQAWEEWGAGLPKLMDPETLAEFLEAHDYHLASGTLNSAPAPSPSFLLTMADKLEVHSSAIVRKERDPNTGRTKLLFTEEKGATLGDTAPPSAFLISIPVFKDSKEPVTVEVRLRVTVQDKKATFKLWIHNAESLLEREMGKLRDEVVLASGVPVFSGVAE